MVGWSYGTLGMIRSDTSPVDKIGCPLQSVWAVSYVTPVITGMLFHSGLANNITT